MKKIKDSSVKVTVSKAGRYIVEISDNLFKDHFNTCVPELEVPEGVDNEDMFKSFKHSVLVWLFETTIASYLTSVVNVKEFNLNGYQVIDGVIQYPQEEDKD